MRYIVILLSSFLILGCSTETVDRDWPRVKTQTIRQVADNSFDIFFSITQNDLNTEIIESGVVWSSGPNPTYPANKTLSEKISEGNFVSRIEFSSNLPKGRYYVRSYLITSENTIYGDLLTLMY